VRANAEVCPGSEAEIITIPSVEHHFAKELVFSSVGKFSGIFSVTFAVAAHSVPRCRVVLKPTQRIESASCPIGVRNTRPLP